jgi:AcrR family transcriptional regulator
VAKSPWISDLRWVRTARQPRSRRTLGLLLDAAEDLISEKGIDDTAVGDIAARAGCSVGAFYHHFRDKGALIQALLARLAQEFRDTMRAAVDPTRWEGASIAEILEAYLEFSLEAGQERAGLNRAQLVLALRDPAAGAQLLELQHELGRRLADLLLARRDEIGHSDPQRAIDFALEQLRSMLILRLEGVSLGSRLESASDADFVREAIASVCAYLQILPPPRPEYLTQTARSRQAVGRGASEREE